MQQCYSLTVKSFKHVMTHNFISPNFCQGHFEEYLLIMDWSISRCISYTDCFIDINISIKYQETINPLYIFYT